MNFRTVTWRVPLIVGVVLRGIGRDGGSIPGLRVDAGPFLKDIPEQDPSGLEVRSCFLSPFSSFCFSQSKRFSRSRKKRKDKKSHSKAKSSTFPFSSGRHCMTHNTHWRSKLWVFISISAAAMGLIDQWSSAVLASPVAALAPQSRSREMILT